MRLQYKFIKMSLLSLAFILMTFSVGNAQEEYSFRVKNNTRVKITKLLVAEPGQKKWKYFDIGAGIGAGKTVTLIWDESTNDEECTQWFKAVYADGTESEPGKYDFCEDDLELVFNP